MSNKYFSEAKKYIPGGVNSPVRAFNSVGGDPVFIEAANGAYIYDNQGNSYVDYINSWGPMILGHGHPNVLAAVSKQIQKGFTYGTPTVAETKIAKLVVDSVPNVDLVRFVNSGTEACMSAIRLSRGYTKRDKIVKFEGCYHGHADSFLIAAGSGAATFGTPNSPGVTKGSANDTLILPYNNKKALEEVFAKHADEIAAVILEPVTGNMGCVVPAKDFMQSLRDLCTKHNSVLIFDEVMTGFRLALGGAQERFGVDADLVCMGKIIGGGMPVGAFGGKKEIMEHLAPIGPVYQAGTLSGNPVGMAAGLATLTELKTSPELYMNLEQTTEILDELISQTLSEKGIPFTTNRLGSMFTIFFSDVPVTDFETAKLANNATFKKFFHHALDCGVYLPPSSFETWFISNEIGEEEIEKTVRMVTTFEP